MPAARRRHHHESFNPEPTATVKSNCHLLLWVREGRASVRATPSPLAPS